MITRNADLERMSKALFDRKTHDINRGSLDTWLDAQCSFENVGQIALHNSRTDARDGSPRCKIPS